MSGIFIRWSLRLEESDTRLGPRMEIGSRCGTLKTQWAMSSEDHKSGSECQYRVRWGDADDRGDRDRDRSLN